MLPYHIQDRLGLDSTSEMLTEVHVPLLDRHFKNLDMIQVDPTAIPMVVPSWESEVVVYMWESEKHG